MKFARSAVSEEYSDSISAESPDSFNEYPEHGNKNLMVWLKQFWRFEEFSETLHYHHSQVHSVPEW